MEIINEINVLRQRIRELKEKGKIIGFVPTLGALHEGHASLIRKSKRVTNVTVCSIFLNPTQFNDPKDLEKYPNTFDQDLELLKKNKTNILFLPAKHEIYPENLNTKVNVDFGSLMSVMEGAHRPGHFEGVVQVVKRLLDIVKPQKLIMGHKDFQQFSIIQHMINSLKIPVELVICRTIREPHGLAMSSRNLRLDPDVRDRAEIIIKTLRAAKRKAKDQNFGKLTQYAINRMSIPDFIPEYFSIVDGNTLQTINSYSESDYIVACTAVWAKNIRLIDNIVIKKQ